MASIRDGPVLRQIQALYRAGTCSGLTDGQLLERYMSGQGERAELAFAALIEHHGPMVLRTCRAVLRDEHDAEDAFQATFLVLARRAGSICRRGSLGSWLFGAATRVARCARSEVARRRRHERRRAEETPEAIADPIRDDTVADHRPGHGHDRHRPGGRRTQAIHRHEPAPRARPFGRWAVPRGWGRHRRLRRATQPPERRTETGDLRLGGEHPPFAPGKRPGQGPGGPVPSGEVALGVAPSPGTTDWPRIIPAAGGGRPQKVRLPSVRQA